ncbi:MAG: hypothetical protein HC913_11015, partial [Microscillaceae bacterium]|nr:hypothetical protein [Microscillaceae bacterium]
AGLARNAPRAQPNGQWRGYWQQQAVLEMTWPLYCSLPIESQSPEEYLKQLPDLPPDYLILLIQAGQAALGHYEAGALLNHKIIRKYMVRAKQGKAQTSHLKTKGKSRAGSRIRLAQTDLFFEEINEKLQDWEVHSVEKIFVSTVQVWWNHLFEADTCPPFDKKDPRMVKIPLAVQPPNFEELERVHTYLSQAHWQFREDWENELFHA